MANVVIGIDPGSRVAGYGILGFDDREVFHIAHGLITTDVRKPFEQRLVELGLELRALVEKYRPTHAAVERIFLGKSADSAFKLGHARGVFLYELAQSKVAVAEYSPRTVKLGITGSGAASKEVVQRFVFEDLKIKMAMKLDASDALAVALHHARQSLIDRRFRAQMVSR